MPGVADETSTRSVRGAPQPKSSVADKAQASCAKGVCMRANDHRLSPEADALASPASEIPGAPACGLQILNPAAFRRPDPETLGNTTRNQFRGPGLFSLDLSVGRSFALGWLGEAGRIHLRLDAYNVLNHVNLNSPSSTFLPEGDFGVALYGREGRPTGFPALSPFLERARQIQALLRVYF